MCSSGVSFFLPVLARAVISVVWRLWTEVARLHPSRWPEAGGWETSAQKRCPGSFPKLRQQCSPIAAAREPRTHATQSLRLCFLSPSRPGAARGPGSCLRPPSSTVGATLSSRGPGQGWGRCRLSPSVGKRGSRHQFRPAPCTLGHPRTV